MAGAILEQTACHLGHPRRASCATDNGQNSARHAQIASGGKVADEMDCKHALPHGQIRETQNPDFYVVHVTVATPTAGSTVHRLWVCARSAKLAFVIRAY